MLFKCAFIGTYRKHIRVDCSKLLATGCRFETAMHQL